MEPISVSWIVLVVGALVFGAATAGLLVVPRNSEIPVGLLAALGMAAAVTAFTAIGADYGRLDAVLYAFAFLLGAAGGGYALVSSLLYRLARDEKAEAPSIPEEAAPGAALIVVGCVEPGQYTPGTTAAMLQSLVDEDLLDASVGTLPFFFFAQKARYRAVGGQSPAISQLSALAERLEGAVPDSGFASVDWATCQGERALHHRVAAAAQAGFRRIVVASVAAADSLSVDGARALTDALRLSNAGVSVVHTPALGDSERLVAMLVGRALDASDALDATGVVLVGQAQPEERSRRNPGFDEGETAFLSRVRMQLLERGIPERNVRIAWADWREPDVTSSVRHLAALGCKRVVVVPATFAFDTITTRLDLEIAVRQARVDERVLVVSLPAWRDDDAVVEELRARAVRALD